MVKHTATIIVRALSGNKAKIVLPHVATLAAAQGFLTSVESAYMEGKGVSVSHAETEKIAATIDAGNTDRRAIITYQDNVDSTTKRISVPSWGTDAGDVLVTPDGERVPLVACQSVIEALETASGRSLTAIEGYIIQKR